MDYDVIVYIVYLCISYEEMCLYMFMYDLRIFLKIKFKFRLTIHRSSQDVITGKRNDVKLNATCVYEQEQEHI